MKKRLLLLCFYKTRWNLVLLLSIFILVVLSISTPNIYAADNDIEELKTEIINLKAEVKILKNYVQEMDKRLTSQIGSLRNEMGSLRNEMGSLRNEMDSLRGEMDSLRNEMDSLRREIEMMKWLMVFLVGLGIYPIVSKSRESKKENIEIENLKTQMKKVIEILTRDGKIL